MAWGWALVLRRWTRAERWREMRRNWPTEPLKCLLGLSRLTQKSSLGHQDTHGDAYFCSSSTQSLAVPATQQWLLLVCEAISGSLPQRSARMLQPSCLFNHPRRSWACMQLHPTCAVVPPLPASPGRRRDSACSRHVTPSLAGHRACAGFRGGESDVRSIVSSDCPR